MTVPKTSVVVLDSAEPELLARFYAELLGATAGPAARDDDLILITGRTGVVLGVRRDPNHAPPSWPPPEDSQQAHLRILVESQSLDEAEREAVALGARPVAAEEDGSRPDNRTSLRRYADPAGHAFVLAAIREDPTPDRLRE
ncbi:MULTISPECIES: VOC family protein [unclassified Streptomyces]|uniref:VOC family protein n=1 Tax=unclassified Streptomyces TaxID=2593676 RepID=UPI001BEB3E8F|nr:MULTISPECIES: VOC family protein [unclassified Streptomyces]MBT2408484.1 VOC family protein [Streptomyces sp. ISL-21]MBT2457967.1 VOC family protein [Streptomyces sp. ISL-86]MBT2611921.1 VOC family protein [Streptomyces sp. ISL-87]